MIDLAKWDKAAFTNLCQDILRGLGVSGATTFSAPKVECAYQMTLERRSTDGMFRTEEKWLYTFVRTRNPLNAHQLQPLADAAISANAGYLFAVIFGNTAAEAEAHLRAKLAPENIRVILLAGVLAETLALDYGRDAKLQGQQMPSGFSFARFRRYAMDQRAAAPWRKHFQTTSVQPMRLLPLHHEQKRKDDALSEADLFRVLKDDSFLLLGEPGAGKTTSLLALAADLAAKGGYTPVFLPLGRYQGDFWNILCEALAPGAAPVSVYIAQSLVASGGLVLLLDGLNEIQNPDLQEQCIAELNRLTAPGTLGTRSRWVVSGRVHDYQQSRTQLTYLESRRWEMQPMTADLVVQILASALGQAQGLALYQSLGSAVREICANPLLLNMVVSVYQEKGSAPAGRGALYRQFVELMLQWGAEWGVGASERAALNDLLSEPLTEERYRMLALEALTSLAVTMDRTMIKWTDAQQRFVIALDAARNPEQAASLLLDDLTRRGILRRDTFNRVSFFHHTFQEYFQARQLMTRPVNELIPTRGVAAPNREAVIFVAGQLADPTPLIKRAIKVDYGLAYEMVRDTHRIIPSNLTHKLAQKLWTTIVGNDGVIGDKRRLAVQFGNLAAMMSQSIEALAAGIDNELDPIAHTDRLMEFYAELGDAAAQQQALKQATVGDEIPEGLLFQAAMAANDGGDDKKAVELYTQYLEKKNPNDAAAFNNRGIAYNNLDLKDKALADYQRAVELNGRASHRTNLADLLHTLGRRDEAFEQVRLALGKDPYHSHAHNKLAEWLESEDVEQSLMHAEHAVRYALNDDDLRSYYPHLTDLQEKLGRYEAAIRSLRQMITLEPTSTEVNSWKARIARLRKALDDEAQTRSARERLLEQGELPLPTLIYEWLRAAGFKVSSPKTNWLLAEDGRMRLAAVLMPDPTVTAFGLRRVVEARPPEARYSKPLLIVTAAEAVSIEARHQLAAWQDEFTLALTTALEVRDALLLGDRECRLLIERTQRRAEQAGNPFEYKGVVREHSEFFGRAADLAELTALLNCGQQVGLYGIHKIGKSSLLEQLRRKLHLSNPEMTVVQVELNAHLKEASDFYREVLEKLPGASDLSQTPTITTASFRQALTGFHRKRAQGRLNHRLLLVLDEYAFLIPDQRGKGGVRGFIEVLGLLKALHQEGWLLVLPCGRTAALNRQASWGDDENPFIDLLHQRFLGPLPRAENDGLMETLGARVKLRFTKDALAAIYRETGGHPSFSRALGGQILRNGKGPVTVQRVKRAVESFLQDHDQCALPKAIYEERLEQEEQEIARKLALKGPQPRKALFPAGVKDVNRRRQISAALDNLLDTTVLIAQDGLIAHRYGLLRRVIEQEMRQLGFE